MLCRSLIRETNSNCSSKLEVASNRKPWQLSIGNENSQYLHNTRKKGFFFLVFFFFCSKNIWRFWTRYLGWNYRIWNSINMRDLFYDNLLGFVRLLAKKKKKKELNKATVRKQLPWNTVAIFTRKQEGWNNSEVAVRKVKVFLAFKTGRKSILGLANEW